MKFGPAITLAKDTFSEWREDEALELGAALAYYTIFSIAPLLLVVIAVAGLVWGREAVQGQIVGQLGHLVGPQGGEAIQTLVANAAKQGRGSSILATIVAFATSLLGATGVFAELQSTLNHIWNVKATPKNGIWGFLRTRVISFGMILGVGFLLLVSLVISAALAAIDNYMVGLMPGIEILIRIVSFVLSLGVITVLLAMIYRYLPDVKISWRDVWVGAAVTALLFTVGKVLLGLYLGRSSTASVFGAAGSLVILLLWIYYSAQILFFGAEFTQVYARYRGVQILPSEHAVRVRQVKEEVPAGKDAGKEKGAPKRPPRTARPETRRA